MGFERKEANNNLGYPSTAYNGSSADDVNAKGLELGSTGGKGTYEVQYIYNIATNGSETSEGDNQLVTLPANASIKSVTVKIVEALTGGTGFTIGLSQPNGTVIDADGLVANSTVATAGATVVGSGALVGAGIGANPAQVTLGGTRTAGKLKVLVEYLA